MFGELGTAFAVVLAFVVFLSFQSYGEAKAQAVIEAVSITELHRQATLFDKDTQGDVQETDLLRPGGAAALEVLGLVELEHNARNNRVRAVLRST